MVADAVFAAVDGAAARIVPVGPPNKFEDVAIHPKATLPGAAIDKHTAELGGMVDFHAAAKAPDARIETVRGKKGERAR